MKNVCGKVHAYRNVSENVRCKISQGICAQIKIPQFTETLKETREHLLEGIVSKI